MAQGGQPEGRPGEAPAPDWLDRWILPFVREPTLWPVLLVLIGHAAAFVAPALLLGVRDRRPAALAATLGLVFGSALVVRSELRRQRRPGALSALVLAVWLLGTGFAVLADRYGVF